MKELPKKELDALSMATGVEQWDIKNINRNISKLLKLRNYTMKHLFEIVNDCKDNTDKESSVISFFVMCFDTVSNKKYLLHSINNFYDNLQKGSQERYKLFEKLRK